MGKKYDVTLQVLVDRAIANYIDERPEGRAGWLRKAIHERIVYENASKSTVDHIAKIRAVEMEAEDMALAETAFFETPLNNPQLQPQEPRY